MKQIINKYIILLGILFLVPTILFGQKKGSKVLSEEVEVVKSYIPKIGEVSKRDIRPSLEKIMQIEVPKLNYSINYKPEKYPFAINYLKVPSYKHETAERLYNGYADISLGAPFSTRANFFYNTAIQRTMIAGVGVNHNGYFGKLKNNLNDNINATQSTNDLMIFFEYQQDNIKIKLSATESFDIYNRYGYNSKKVNQTSNIDDSFKQHFIRTTANVEIGTSFKDVNDYNAKLYASFNTVADNYSYNESIYQTGVYFAKGFKNANSLLAANIEYLSVIPTRRFMISPLEGERDNIPDIMLPDLDEGRSISPTGLLSFAPRYVFKYRGIDLDMGVKMIFDFNGKINNYKQGITTILPEAELSFSFASGAVKPYLKVDGEFINNNYSSLTEHNPYIMEGLTAPNSIIRRYMFGISGNATPSLYYNVYFGLRQSRELLMFVNDDNGYNGNVFTAMVGDFDNLEVGVNMGYIMTSMFNFTLDMKYIDYENVGIGADSQKAYGYAPFVAKLGANIEVTKSLMFSLSGIFQSSRTFLSRTGKIDGYVETKVGSVFDLTLRGEYKLSKRLAISIDASNLLNQKLYPFNNYRGIGINVLAGISYKF